MSFRCDTIVMWRRKVPTSGCTNWPRSVVTLSPSPRVHSRDEINERICLWTMQRSEGRVEGENPWMAASHHGLLSGVHIQLDVGRHRGAWQFEDWCSVGKDYFRGVFCESRKKAAAIMFIPSFMRAYPSPSIHCCCCHSYSSNEREPTC
jgi:hypothetical protein